ncbi:MAG: hypothetical protein OEY93_08300 [Anaerolineae bacterium]|nr:hypothetical protein [Anaerolineae bacterium]
MKSTQTAMPDNTLDARIRRGMQSQLNFRQERIKAGDTPLGWKIGFGSPAALENLRIDAPLIGGLMQSARLATGSGVSIASWTNPAVEPEIALYLSRDLPEAPDRETVRAAVGAVGPAIEIADVNITPEAGAVEAILAGNIFNRHVVLGQPDPGRAGCVLDGLVGRVFKDEEEIAIVDDPQGLTGDLLDLLSHVANTLAQLGAGLRAGEVVIMGSIIPPLWVEDAMEMRYVLDPVDTISAKIIDGK